MTARSVLVEEDETTKLRIRSRAVDFVSVLDEGATFAVLLRAQYTG